MGKKVTVAAAQIFTGVDVLGNSGKVCERLREAHRAGCEVVSFHEGCLTGFPTSRAQLARLDLAEVREAERKVGRLAKRLGMAVILGSTSREDGRCYNDALIIHESGKVLGRYAKTWRAGEPFYGPGSGPVIFRVAGFEATIIICHDLRFPELPRLAVAAGAQVVFICNNESGITAEHKLLGYRSMQISRATENLAYAVMANAPADPSNVRSPNTSHGNSKIVDPMGNVLDEAKVFEKHLVVATIDLSKATREPALRTLGKASWLHKTYGASPEHPAYTAWMEVGLKLVRRLDGTNIR